MERGDDLTVDIIVRFKKKRKSTKKQSKKRSCFDDRMVL